MSEPPRCVCGDTEDKHRTTTMSVPLNKSDLPTAAPPTPTVKTNPNATYERNECTECGCGEYLKDEEVTP